MTFAQFKRMKPKYKFRLFLLCVVIFLLFIGLLYGISFGISAVSRAVNTTKLKDVTSANVLQVGTMTQIREVMKQEDSANILVEGSEVVCGSKGEILSVRMELVNLSGEKAAEYWTLSANEKKAELSKTQVLRENMSSLKGRKLTFQEYYPALSRVNSLQFFMYLEENCPVGEAGRYRFTDDFGNNLQPAYGSYLTNGFKGVLVSEVGYPSPFGESYNLGDQHCVPTLLAYQAADSSKGKGGKAALEEEKEYGVILLKTGPYLA